MDPIFLWAQWGILNFDQYQIVLRQFGDLETAWHKINVPFLLQLGFGLKKAERVFYVRQRMDFEGALRLMGRLNIRLLFIEESDYPSVLKSIPSPPPFLFMIGELPSLHKVIGVVGTRQITDYGRLSTEMLVTDLVRSGFVIVSGLALGIDACAHETTLRSNGVTLSVLGSGLDRLYPVVHQHLAKRIVEAGGALISEYPIGTPALQYHFPIRNRVISGLSRGVLIVEGGVKSGALITARYALEQGREVFAIPNNIHKKGLSGTNHLIRRGEAKLVETANHILEEFQMEPTPSPASITLSSIESELIECLMNEGKTIDELTVQTSYNVAKLSELLIGLQLKGVAREINRKWVLV